MGPRILSLASLLLALIAPPLTWADTTSADPLFVILYKQGPAWKEGVPMQKQDAMGAHYRYMKTLFEAGVILEAGPTLDEPGGVVVLKAKDLDDAKGIMARDPSITQKMFMGEVHSWSQTFHPSAAPAASTGPTRSASGHTIKSGWDPVAQIDMPSSAQFVGVDSWVLQAYWDSIMLYAFVDADAQRQAQHLYWVQFEEYLPNHPELHHSYDSQRHVTLGGMDFLVDTWAGYTDTADEPDSDTAHLKAVLVTKGYTLPRSMVTVRFVHLMDGARKELMFIYKEPAPDGLSADDLKKGGRAYDQWPELEKSLIARGQQSFLVH